MTVGGSDVVAQHGSDADTAAIAGYTLAAPTAASPSFGLDSYLATVSAAEASWRTQYQQYRKVLGLEQRNYRQIRIQADLTVSGMLWSSVDALLGRLQSCFVSDA